MSATQVLGHTEPDPVGEWLGTGYQRFHSSTGCRGLVIWTDERLEILAVDSLQPGSGQFRRFIQACQAEWPCITVWHIMNPVMDKILPRYGFYPWTEVEHKFGETMTGYRWDKPSA